MKEHAVAVATIRRLCLATSALMLAFSAAATAQSPAPNLAQGFASPPESAKPRVWWHWMNGNVTKEGIKLDLEWMHRIGLGGFQTFDVSRDFPQVIDNRLVYMAPAWKDAFRYATLEAGKLGLQMGIAGSPGWSESGGPWVKPEQAMKKLVWSETAVKGGARFTGPLAQPPSTTGPFQNIPRARDPSISKAVEAQLPVPSYYHDVAVIAYKVPGDAATPLQPARVTSSAGAIDARLLDDGDYNNAIDLAVGDAAHPGWISYDFGSAQPIHAISVAMAHDNWARPMTRRPTVSLGKVAVSDDGRAFRAVADLPGFGADEKTAPAQHTVALDGVRARYVRVTFAAPPANSHYRTAPFSVSAVDAKVHRIAELVVHREPRINRFEEKAAFGTLPDYFAAPTPAVGKQAIAQSDVLDLSSRMKADGSLDWTAPPGAWKVLRFGYSLVGTRNHPAALEATGLEVDKLSRKHVESYFTNYLNQYQDATGGLMGRGGVENMITDSWEAGIANWTEAMRADFAKRAGYDMTRFMPVLAGRVVDSAEASERFLWDFRKVIGDLVVDNHYGQIADLLHARGMRQYGESLERERPTIGDGMAFKHRADVPMGAFWVRRALNESMPNYGIDLRESASVAHIYGQNLVAAESLTANAGSTGWIDSPRTLKPVADEMMALGLNQFVIHTSAHQALVGKAPGFTLGVYGQHFNRNEAWAEQANAWISYLARSSYLLQQGHFVADIAYFYGEEAPITELFRDGRATPPEIPDGYGFDFVNTDVLANRLSVKDGRLLTASGASYALLYLGGSSRKMTLATARRLRDLVKAGATVVGARPEGSPSLGDDQAAVKAVFDELWGMSASVRSVGAGVVVGQSTLAEALRDRGIQPDFDYDNPDSNTKLMFVHRRVADGDIYYVTNRSSRAENIKVDLRTSGREAEIWFADTGAIKPASYRIEHGRTTVPLALDPDGTAFIVLRKPATVTERAISPPVTVESTFVDGSWQVNFPADRGAPPQVTLNRLASWSENSDPGVRYFSGTATYQRDIEAPASWLDGSEVWLDLGDVREVAEVSLNGHKLPTLWKRPYRVNLASALKPGRNTVEIKVTNLWPNRLIGDLQPGAKKYTYTVAPVYRADSPLLPSGLLGPVRIDVLSLGQPSK